MNKRKITFHTLETIMQRTQEVGDCVEWQGYVANRSPQVSHGGKITTVRKLIRELQGRPTPMGVFVSATCGNHLCVNPAHLIDRTMSQHAKMMSSKIDYDAPVRIAKLQKSAAGRRKISDEGVAAALSDPRSSRAVADEHGVHKSLIARIRRGQAHRQLNAKTNFFAGLMR